MSLAEQGLPHHLRRDKDYLELAHKLSDELAREYMKRTGFGAVGVLTPIAQAIDGMWVEENFFIPNDIDRSGGQKIRNLLHTRVRTERISMVERFSPDTQAWNIVPAFMVRGPQPMLYLMTREWPLIVHHEIFLAKHIESRKQMLEQVRLASAEVRSPAVDRMSDQETLAYANLRFDEPEGEPLLGDLVIQRVMAS